MLCIFDDLYPRITRRKLCILYRNFLTNYFDFDIILLKKGGIFIMNHKHSLFGKCKSVLLTVALASAFTAVGQVDADEVKKNKPSC